MKRRRILAMSVGTLVLGGLLLASGGPGVTPAEAQNPTSQQQQLRQILDKLDQILAATKSSSGGGEVTKSSGAGTEDNHALRWDQVLPVSQRFVILQAFNSDAVLDKETGLVWEKSPQTTAVSSANVRLTCANKAVGGRKGWRLPSLTELSSLPTIGRGRRMRKILPSCGVWASAMALCSASVRLSTSAPGVFVVERTRNSIETSVIGKK